MSKILLDYNESTGEIKDSNGLTVYMVGMIGFELENKAPVLDLIKQGITPDEIIKLKNNDLL